VDIPTRFNAYIALFPSQAGVRSFQRDKSVSEEASDDVAEVAGVVLLK
jgi:hypothetical protein